MQSKKILLQLDKPFTDLFNILPKIIHINILDFKKESYTFKCNKRSQRIYDIDFDFLTSSTKHPILNLKINYPISIAFHQSHILENNEKNLTMNSYFEGEELELKQLESAVGANIRFGNMANTVINVASIASPRSGFSFRGWLTVVLIQFLRSL